MENQEKMYAVLFGAQTEALDALRENPEVRVFEILKDAQLKTEKMFMDGKERGYD